MKKSILILLVLFIGLVNTSLNAQLEFPEDKVSWNFTATQNGEDVTIIGTITMVEHWHIYAAHIPAGSFTLPSTVSLVESSNFKTIGGLTEPKPHFEHDELADEDLYYHSNTIQFKQKIKVLSDKDFILKGVFGFQTCDDTHCLPPHEADFEVKIKGIVKEASIEVPKLTDLEESFVTVNGDEAKDKTGASFVKVDDSWHKVPEGNSIAFFKKYLSLGGNDEK